MQSASLRGGRRAGVVACVGALALYAAIVLRTTWVTDDAFITLRVVDNIVDGYGPRWNVDERVQAFTHPLWLWTLLPLYAVSRDPYLTAVSLCWLASIGGAALLARRVARRDPWDAAVAIVALTASRAFIDYSTSGLENPLTHLLLIVFAGMVLDNVPWSERRVFAAASVAGLVVLNRTDAALLVVPALGWALFQMRRGRAAAVAALGFAPFAAWEAFAIVYYGSPWPNTALAKLNTGLPKAEMIRQGLTYLTDALRHDPATVGLIAAGCLAAALRRRPRELILAAGIVAYVAYTVWIGGDFMAGRFLAAPMLVAVILLAEASWFGPARVRVAAAVIVATVGALVVGPTLGSNWARSSRIVQYIRPTGIADERRFYFEIAGLFTGRDGERPAASYTLVNQGRDMRRAAVRLTVQGAIGYLGFYAGPRTHIVDVHALSDPLLARLPVVRRDLYWAALARDFRPRQSVGPWRIGHFRRRIPEGYLASLFSGENRIRDPEIARLWDRIVHVTRGPLWSGSRFGDILALMLSRETPRPREEDAPIDWREILRLNPTDVEAAFRTGVQRLESGDPEGARSALEIVVNASTQHEESRLRLAALELNGNIDRAASLVAEAGALAPYDPEVASLRGDIARVRNRLDDAARAYLDAARLERRLIPGMYSNLALLQSMKGDDRGALEWVSKALEVDPDDPKTLYNQGWILVRLGRREDAARAFEHALAADPDLTPALEALRGLKGGGR